MSGVLKSVVPIHNIDANGIERADAHGVRVRLTCPTGKNREWAHGAAEQHHRADLLQRPSPTHGCGSS